MTNKMKQKIVTYLEDRMAIANRGCNSWKKSDDRGVCYAKEVDPLVSMIAAIENISVINNEPLAARAIQLLDSYQGLLIKESKRTHKSSEECCEFDQKVLRPIRDVVAELAD